MAHRPIITLTTDFGLSDHFVGTVKGVILGIAADAEIVDICHSVQAFDVLDGALTTAKEEYETALAATKATREPGKLEAAAKDLKDKLDGIESLPELQNRGKL